MDRLTSMAVFSRVLELRSFSGAARELDISQATVSKHVQTLEEWLGIHLLTRTTRRVMPTQDGEGFYARCQRILSEMSDIRSTTGISVLTGNVRIACPGGIPSNFIGGALGRLLAAHPGLSVETVVTNAGFDLATGGYDAVISMASAPPAGMLIQRLTAVPLVLCAAPEYLARRGRPQRPEELVAHDCISGITPEFQSWRFFASRAEGATEIAIPIKGRLTSRSAVLLRDAAVGGAGILLIPPRMAEADLVAGRLVPLLQEFPPAPLTLNAFFSPDQHLSNRLRATLDALIAHLSTI